MGFGQIILLIFLVFYTRYFGSLFLKSKRDVIKQSNSKLNSLREIPCKSLDQQKEFINIRYPKKNKFKFRWIMVPKFIFQLALYILMFKIWSFVLGLTGWDVKIWQAILIIFIGPIIINYVLKYFDLQRPGDLSIWFRGGNRK